MILIHVKPSISGCGIYINKNFLSTYKKWVTFAIHFNSTAIESKQADNDIDKDKFHCSHVELFAL